MIEVFDCEQGSDEWKACRAGIPSASRFSDILAKGEGKMRSKYLRELAGERLTGEVAESFSNGHMDRGRIMEDEARDTYAFINNVEPKRVGFVRNGDKGASPDSLIGDDGGLEIKTALPHIQIERILQGKLPSEHRAQVQGNIWVCEREWWEFISHWPKLPQFKIRVYRDEAYIRELSDAIDAFNDELSLLVERIRAYGAPRGEVLKNQLVQAVLAG